MNISKIKANEFEKKIGFSTNIFENPEDMESLTKKLGKHFSVIEVEFEHELKNIFHYTQKQQKQWIEKLLQVKHAHNLHFSVHAPYLGQETDIAAMNPVIRREAVETMKKTLDISHQLGAEILTCHPGYIEQSAEFETRMMDNLSRSLDEMVGYAHRLGISISLENTGSHRPKYILLDYEKHQKLCEKHGIGLTLDLIHYTSFNPMNDNYFDGLKHLLPCVKNIHFADMKMPYHAHLPLGAGDFNYHQVISFLYENGYTGNAIIEETASLYPKELYLSHAINYKETLKLFLPEEKHHEKSANF